MIWPFKRKPKQEYVRPELREVRVGGQVYTPQADITPQEVAYLIPIFSTASWGLSYGEWIEKHNLSRHFTQAEE